MKRLLNWHLRKHCERQLVRATVTFPSYQLEARKSAQEAWLMPQLPAPFLEFVVYVTLHYEISEKYTRLRQMKKSCLIWRLWKFRLSLMINEKIFHQMKYGETSV